MQLDSLTPAEIPESASAPPPEPKGRLCPNCGVSFSRPARGPGGHKRYCSTECRHDWGNREKAHGSVIVTVAKVWRKNRGSGEVGKAAFQRFVEALDLLIAEDEDAKRPPLRAGGPVDDFLRSVVEDRYLDRKRR